MDGALVSRTDVVLLTFEIETQKSFNNDKVAYWHRLSSASIYYLCIYIRIYKHTQFGIIYKHHQSHITSIIIRWMIDL